MWPLTSPPRRIPSSRILRLRCECPVFHITGTPPCARMSLIDDIRAHGGVPVMWKTGHSHLKRKMREEGILLGGEVSGHMFFAENYYGVDDEIGRASCRERG